MISTAIIRGVVAGLLAGFVAGLFALTVAEPSIDSAIALEEAAAAEAPESDVPHAGEAEDPGISRTTQKAGLVVGTSLFGIGVGALFGVAVAWSRGRLQGDVWQRSLKVGATAVGVLVVLPVLAYPPNPPAVGDPATIGTRTALYVATVLIGLAVALGGWYGARALTAAGWSRSAVHATVAAGVLVVAGVALVALPGAEGAGEFPADLLWRFRLSSLGTQLLLVLGTAATYGLLAVRGEQRMSEQRVPAPA